VSLPIFHQNSSESNSHSGSCSNVDIPSIDWWVTSRCNLSCDFCYGPKPAADPIHLRDLIAARISSSPTRVVTLCGGEPLLVRKISEYAERQRAAGKLVVLNTNGELLRRRFDSTSSLPFDIVGISIDGADADMHGRMRGVNADFAETLAAARWLRDCRHEVKRKIATVVSRVNAGHIEELALLVRDLAPDVWRLYQYSPWGPQNHGQNRYGITEKEFADAVGRASAVAAPVDVRGSTMAATGGCLIVDPSGQVLRQEGDGYMAIGNCLDELMADVWRRAPQQAMIRTNKLWLRSI
jgi:MoaA/NifB/PqqE/SkfB family radical SAM enzyme